MVAIVSKKVVRKKKQVVAEPTNFKGRQTISGLVNGRIVMQADGFAYCRKLPKSSEFAIHSAVYCRESFHRGNYHAKMFLFKPRVTGQNIEQRVAGFIDVIETKLGVKNKSEFGPCQIPMYMWVRPSEWW